MQDKRLPSRIKSILFSFEIMDQIDKDFAIDKLFITIDAWVDKPSVIDEFLSHLDVRKFSVDFLIGVLTITLQYKHLLTNREDFYKMVVEETNIRGENEEYLFDGLE